ncbi:MULTISPECIES: EamA family transporter [Methylobacterium]|jgi:transporter family protein|uniref:EamA family transporter n=1 Tax=Methylobacterium TaxID=407 RepID=UPI0008E71ECC|nr:MULTISPECIES: EamA family transporter [Methylobacterium]MBZ6414993.1 EamA family transporter [Methylobacterium sp.]MBK3396598.1 EamA family transporter [Methylobacterium ajmalii]MBK3408581.1 EamA family transporter [Methylobacterium ajmalii]MBK3424557.1 EamA family transporter [Methylobacterium ajmalii]SFF65689.1 transporter family protein [Methylobacterium sp. yr596]
MSWQLWALVSAVFTALTALLARAGSAGAESDAAAFMRSVVILLALGAICLATGQWQALRGLTGRNLGLLSLSGLATAGSWACYFRALKTGGAAQVATLNKLSIVLVAVLGATLLGERLSGINWLGISLVTAGAYLLAYRG